MTIISDEHKAVASVVSTGEATIAVVSIEIDGITHSWEGTAKRDTSDKFNLEIGRKLAMSRALDKAARQLERQANGMVKCTEDNRIQSLNARKRPRTQRFRVRNSGQARQGVASSQG